jgi:hypothetical protein
MYEPCVKCGFRAAVTVQSMATGRRLDMCSHHYVENRIELENRGWYTIIDLREAVQ